MLKRSISRSARKLPTLLIQLPIISSIVHVVSKITYILHNIHNGHLKICFQFFG